MVKPGLHHIRGYPGNQSDEAKKFKKTGQLKKPGKLKIVLRYAASLKRGTVISFAFERNNRIFHTLFFYGYQSAKHRFSAALVKASNDVQDFQFTADD